MSMERDMNLIRELLIELKSKNPGESFEANNEKENYHMYLILKDGLIDAEMNNYADGNTSFDYIYLTPTGHDFLDAAENETVWNKTKEALKQQGIEISKIPISVLTGYLKVKFSEFLGI